MKSQTKIIALALLVLYLLSISSFSLAPVQALVIESVSVNPNEIAPGEISVIKIEVENDGEEDVKDVSIALDLTEVPFAPFDSTSEFGISEIREGRTKYAEFEIVALSDAKSGIYKIPVQISYSEEEKVKTKNSLISIGVNSEPVIDISFEEGLLLKGKENNLVVKVVNKGLSDVEFVEVEIGSSAYYSILSPKNVYIGDVDSDDFDNVEFKIYFKENVPDRINFPVVVNYKDAMNKEYSKDFNLQLNVYSKKKAIELGLMKRNYTPIYIGVAIVLILVYVVYRKIRKRKRPKIS